MIVVLIALAVVLGGINIAASIIHRQDLENCRRGWSAMLEGAHASAQAALEREQQRVDALLTQVQANSQGFQHYPQLGPFPAPEPEVRYYTDPTGIISAREDELVDDDAFDQDLRALGIL